MDAVASPKWERTRGVSKERQKKKMGGGGKERRSAPSLTPVLEVAA